jgi:AraC family L-rhamnose operon transcriptional activator RhaR/AraC family L-rhamnose operon regulatory protein RhaS
MEFNTVSGDVFLIQGMQQHYFKQRNDLVFFNIMFKPERLPLPVDQLEGIPGYHAIFNLEPAYRKRHDFNSHLHLDIAGLEMVSQIAWRMWSETKQHQPGMEAALLGDLIVLIITLSRLYSASAKTPQSHALLRMANVIGKIEHAYSTSWTLAELAHLAGMSKANLHKAFKENTGKSPIDYVIHVRLKHAKTLLSHSTLSITDIAFQVGLNDSNYFTRRFKQAFGITPSTYRKRLKQP